MTEISKVNIPEGITKIGSCTFFNCTNLKQINLSKGLKTIGNSFIANTAIKSLCVPSTVTDSANSAGNGATGGALALEEVIFEEGMTKVPDYFCANSTENVALVKVEIPESVTEIGNYAFKRCSGLKNIKFKKNISKIDFEAFGYCTGLKSIEFQKNDEKVKDANGQERIHPLVLSGSSFSNCTELNEVVLSPNVEEIGRDVFYGCTALKQMDIPEGVEKIGERAFAKCKNLERINLPEGLKEIGYRFIADTAVRSLKVPKTVNRSGNHTGDGATGGALALEEVIFEEGTTKVPDYFCANSTANAALVKAEIPESVTEIGRYAFSRCSGLESISFKKTINKIGFDAYAYCTGLKKIEFQKNDEIVKDSNGLERLYPLILEGTNFRECTGLEEVVLSPNVEEIGRDTFYGCTALKQMDIPEGVEKIGERAFAKCKNLERINLPEGLKEIGYRFIADTAVRSLKVPKTVNRSGNYTGDGATGGALALEEVIFEEGMIKIPDYFCANNKANAALVKVEIPESVTEIGKYAFKNCTNITIYGYKNSCAESYAIENNIPFSALDDEENKHTESDVYFFSQWDAEKQIAYWSGLDLYGSQVTARTDTSFLENLDNLVGKYVLVTKRSRREGVNGPSELISIQSVETRSGIISAADENNVTVNGNTYTLAKKLKSPDSYVNEFALYHILSDGTVYVQMLDKSQGTLTYWNAKKKQLKIGNINYKLGACAEKDSIKFLGETGYTSVYVEYWCDWSQHIYKITDKIDSTTSKVPNYYETYVPPTKEEEILWQNVQEWDRAYETYVEAVRNALRSFSGTEGEKKETTVSAEAKRMQKADRSSSSKYLTGNLGRYSDYAYKALAEYLYEYTCDNMEFSSLKDTDMVNSVMKALSGAKKTYRYGDDIEITVNMTLLNKSGTGHLEIKEKGRQVQLVIINTPQKEVEVSVAKYLDALQDLAMDSMVNVATAVSKDILGESLSGLTEKYISKTVDNIEKKLAVKLSEKFNLAGVGNFIQGVNKCYSFYSYVNANMGHWDNIEGILGNVEKLEFKDTTIKDAAVKKAMSGLEKSKKQFIRSFQKYIAGTLGEEKGFYKLFFKCPVDIEVYNSKGEKIGCASETELWYDDSIEIVSQDEAKTVTVLTEDLPSVKVFSREYGTMDYTIEELNADHKPIGRLNYYDISLTPGQEYSMDVNKNLEQNKDTMVIKTNGQSIPANEFVSVKESAGVLISCKAEADDENEGGSIKGSGTYIRGNAVVLYAIPDDGYSFNGWYQGDSLVSLNKTYEFTARNNIVFTAKFVRVAKEPQSCNHVWDKGKITKQPTVSKAGEKVFTCTICGKKMTKAYGKKLKATIKVNITSLVLQKKQSTKSVKVTMANGDSVKSWKSSNNKIVTVDKKGVIKAQNKTGNAKITVTLKSGKSATVKVKVQKAKVKTTKLNNLKSKISLKKGKTVTLKPAVTPVTSQEKVTYKSSNKKIATVNTKGVIKGQKKGTVTITVQSGKCSKKIKVTVK